MGVDTGRLRVVDAEASPEPPLRSDGRRRARAQRTGHAGHSGQAAQASAPARAAEPAQALEPASEAAEGFTSPGPYIKAQRKRRGMSLDQLAAVTKIPRPHL